MGMRFLGVDIGVIQGLGVPKIMAYPFGATHNKDYCLLGSMLGFLVVKNYH